LNILEKTLKEEDIDISQIGEAQPPSVEALVYLLETEAITEVPTSLGG
jgi:hypothetical protein